MKLFRVIQVKWHIKPESFCGNQSRIYEKIYKSINIPVKIDRINEQIKLLQSQTQQNENERMTLFSDDIDDKSINHASVLEELGDVVLPSSGNSVIRWPGRGDVIFDGIWINGSASNSININRNETVKIKLLLKALKSGTYGFRYLVTFWNRYGKRMAILENNVDNCTLNEGQGHEVVAALPENVLGIGEYHLTFSLFDISSADSSKNEMDGRLDVIYKSITLSVQTESKNINESNVLPCFSVPMQTSCT